MPNYTFTKRNQNNRGPQRKGLKTLIAISFALVLITVLVQLFVMSEFATKGDDIAKLEQKRSDLTNENLQLERQIAEARNLDYIKSKNQDQGYVALKSSELKYVNLGE